MITSKLTAKAQTTIPKAVRNALHLREGDDIVYVIEEGKVIVTKANAVPIKDPFGISAHQEKAARGRLLLHGHPLLPSRKIRRSANGF